MSISTLGKLFAEVRAPTDRIQIYKSLTANATMQSSWRLSPLQGAIPTVPVVPTNLTVGALGQKNGGANALRLVGVNMTLSGCLLWWSDRLSHMGGLSGIVTTPQTTNLPTAPLTRYTSGEGVLIMAEIYAQVGVTVTTVSATYTNSAGTPGRVTPLTIFGGNNNRAVARNFPLPFQQGDTGARSVESVTVTATTGTAGNFGITLCKPLVPISTVVLQPQMAEQDAFVYLGGYLPEILDNACLYAVVSATVVSAVYNGDVRFAEDT